MFNRTTSSNGAQGAQWERQTLQRILLEHVREQRRSRRWGIFFKLVFLGIIIYIFFSFFKRDLPQPVATAAAHTALVEVQGAIDSEEEASADNVRRALKHVFENKNVKGLVIRINSPGGSAVQARQIYEEVLYYKQKHPNIKVYAAIEDMGTSAAYLIACAADEIYADQTSMVGSIGVLISSFGFVDGMHKIGVERRLLTAGANKGILDPFSPLKPDQEAFVKEQLSFVHEAFIKNVRDGRGNRLKETPEIFSGLFWTGVQALPLGLIDGFGDAQYIARELVKAENLVDYSVPVNFLERFATRIGASATRTMMQVKIF